MTHPLLTRAHLEAVLLARVLLDPDLAESVAFERLSPAALTLLFATVLDPATAGGAGFLAAATPSGRAEDDAFVVRLAKRAEALSLMDLTFYPRPLLLHLVNQLPVLHRDAAEMRAQYALTRDAAAWVLDVLERRAQRRAEQRAHAA